MMRSRKALQLGTLERNLNEMREDANTRESMFQKERLVYEQVPQVRKIREVPVNMALT